jgi:hypothetical protein
MEQMLFAAPKCQVVSLSKQLTCSTTHRVVDQDGLAIPREIAVQNNRQVCVYTQYGNNKFALRKANFSNELSN